VCAFAHVDDPIRHRVYRKILAGEGPLLTVAEDADVGVVVVADDADVIKALPAGAGRALVGVVAASSVW